MGEGAQPDVSSNLIGLAPLSVLATGRWRSGCRSLRGRTTGKAAGAFDPTNGAVRGANLLAAVVRSAAATQGVIDTFVVIAGMTAIGLILVVTQKAAPVGPASAYTPFIHARPRGRGREGGWGASSQAGDPHPPAS